MNDHEDNPRYVSLNSVLTVYLSAVVLGLLAAIAVPFLSNDKASFPALASSEEMSLSASVQPASSGPLPMDLADADAPTATSPKTAQDGGPGTSALAPDVGETLVAGSLAANNDAGNTLNEIDFDLGEQGASRSSARPSDDGRIEVSKPVVSGGAQLGFVEVTIDRNARLFVKGSDVKSLLESQDNGTAQASRIGPDGLVSFQRLRELGVNLRYDPVADNIVLQPG